VTPFEAEQLLLDTSTLGLDAVVQSLLLSFFLGLVVAAVYRWSLPERIVPPQLMASLALLPMITALVMMVIGNSLARAFSLVGALAIVRFRTRLRSTWDISFVFFALAVGIGCGVGALENTALGTLVIVLAIVVLGALPFTRAASDVQTLRCDVAAYELGEGALAPLIDKYARRRWLTTAQSQRFGEAMTLTYRIVLKRKARLEPLVRELSALEGVERVTLMSEEGSS